MTPETALARAADALDRAEMSGSTQHTEALVKVADGWIRLADALVWQASATEGATRLPMPSA